MQTQHTIYIDSNTTRRFKVGDVFTTYIAEVPVQTEIVGLQNGVFQIRYAGSDDVVHILGMLLARSLKPWRRPLEQLNYVGHNVS